MSDNERQHEDDTTCNQDVASSSRTKTTSTGDAEGGSHGGGVAGDTRRQVKRAKVTGHEPPQDLDVHLKNLPACEAYEKSYNHRDVVTHVCVTKTQFLITASLDGVIKFWKKTSTGIVFVKNFKSHTGPIEDLSLTPSGDELASISRKDKSVKVFDIVNFDMINMFSLEFEPKCIEWIDQATSFDENLAISDSNSPTIYTFDSRQSSSEPKSRIEHIHTSVVCRMRRNAGHNFMVSVDTSGLIKYWRPKDGEYVCLKHPNSTPEHDTVIRDFIVPEDRGTSAKRIRLHNISFTPDGHHFATTSSDRKIRVFKFTTGKKVCEYDESLEKIIELQRAEPFMNNMDFARKMSIERDLDKNQSTCHETALFDESGHFLFYPTMFGVKVRNWRTGELIKSIGREETNFRPLCISLFQGRVFDKQPRRFDAKSLAKSGAYDPTLYSTSYKKNRFYCFSNRDFDAHKTEDEQGELIRDRDIFNEMPTREEILAATEIEQMQQKISFENATIHTTLGDIHLKLFPQQTPKTCENFCTHAKNNYYNNHIFHRVIDQFMIQTGDPTGTGVGGESIWEDDFEDEFSNELKHDKPFVLSMANRGPNTNGSQFFITVAPCPSLDKKHTVFGKVTRGMDVCQKISKVKTDPKTDKPHDDIKIVNINVF